MLPKTRTKRTEVPVDCLCFRIFQCVLKLSLVFLKAPLCFALCADAAKDKDKDAEETKEEGN